MIKDETRRNNSQEGYRNKPGKEVITIKAENAGDRPVQVVLITTFSK